MANADSTIVAITTIAVDRLPNAMWVEIETADGRVGLGETYGSPPAAMAAWFHDTGAAYLLGENADDIERHWWAIYGSWAPAGIGLETRVLSMVDIALWDLFAKRAGLPLVAMLGGAVRPMSAPTTPAGTGLRRGSAIPGGGLVGIRRPGGKYEDLWAFRNEADRLARTARHGLRRHEDLAVRRDGRRDGRQGDQPAPAPPRAGADPQDPRRGRRPDRRRDRAARPLGRRDGDGHRRELEPYNGRSGSRIRSRSTTRRSMAQIVAHTSRTIAAGENLGAFYRFTELIGSGLGLVIADQKFVGGITAAHRVADLAGQHRRSFACHDCADRSTWRRASTSPSTRRTPGYQEMVRAFYFGWYEELATACRRLESGRLHALDVPGPRRRAAAGGSNATRRARPGCPRREGYTAGAACNATIAAATIASRRPYGCNTLCRPFGEEELTDGRPVPSGRRTAGLGPSRSSTVASRGATCSVS